MSTKTSPFNHETVVGPKDLLKLFNFKCPKCHLTFYFSLENKSHLVQLKNFSKIQLPRNTETIWILLNSKLRLRVSSFKQNL